MGNMYRGFNKTGQTPASIPSKYQTVVIINKEKKGFSSQTRRFPSRFYLVNETPGPGSYGHIPSAEVTSPSFSKKGTTGFVASKAARNLQKSTPGPNEYNLQSSFIKKNDFSSGASRVFRLPVAVQMEGPKDKTPAPNQYDVNSVNTVRFSSVVGTSSFLSRTIRDSICPNRNVPSPGHYELSSNLIQSSRAVSSPFKSKTQRIPGLAGICGPGPGTYSPHQAPAPVKKSIVPRGGYLVISAPPLVVPKDPPLPGPGHYDIRDHDRGSKHPKPTAAFASRTDRTIRNSGADLIPGPGFYDPRLQSKHSFFYNDSRIWLPA